MKSMFWKLFLSFLLTIFFGGGLSILTIITFGYLSPNTRQDEQIVAMDQKLSEVIIAAGTSADQVYRFGGEEEYLKYVDAVQRGTGIQIILVTSDNLKINGKRVSQEQENIVKASRHTQQPVLHKKPGLLTVGRDLSFSKSEGTVMIGTKKFGPPHKPLAKPDPPPLFVEQGLKPSLFLAGQIIKTVVMLLIIAGVCYFLARSLSLPLKKLQQTTRRIARGDYSARVGSKLGPTGSEINDLGREFDIMAERTEKAIHAQNRLLRDISHELRSPLARLNVALELARSHCQKGGDKALSQIDREANRLNDLIGQLIILTRLESGGQLQVAEPVNLTELLAEVACDVNFETSIDDRFVQIVNSVPVVVRGSRELLRRALENIIRNGARFTAPNTCVDISLTLQDKMVLITVIDNGPGVPERDLPHLFEPFYRVAESRERGSGGVGIGLTISRQAILAHSGKIILKNRRDSSGIQADILLPFDNSD